MKTIKVSPKLEVASQPTLDEIAALADQGYTLVINNRPDGEEGFQPGTAAENRTAQAAGLAYLHLPVGAGPLTEADVRALQHAVDGSAGKVLAHCRSGTRSLNLWVIGEVLDGRMAAEDLPLLAQQTGIDLRGAEAWLSYQGKD